MKSHFTKNDERFLIKNLLTYYTKPVVCAEVGNRTGTSTRFFSTHLPKKSRFYSVDIKMHDIDVPDNVIRVHSCSLRWNVSNNLDFVYLDGDHNTSHVIKEIEKFSKVTNTIAGHDCGHVAYALFKQFQNKEKHCELLFDNHCSSWIIRIMHNERFAQ